MWTGRAITTARKRRKLSRAELAKLVGVSRQAIYDWERGKDIKLSNLRKVARVCDTTVAALVGAA